MLAIGLLSACNTENNSDYWYVSRVSSEQCSSGLLWTGGDRESELMHPGLSCMGCHGSDPEAPDFIVAGTVYQRLDDADECFGVADVIVEVTDATGQLLSLTTNDAGNFFLESEGASLTMPYTAVVRLESDTGAMQATQANGDCAGCHIEGGTSGAPGRIRTP